MLDKTCYAYTAGHVLRSPGAEVVLTDREAFQVRGRALAVDPDLDLGLIRIDEPATRARKLCSGRSGPDMIRWQRATQRFKSQVPDVWLDMVSTAAGGLSRFELDLKPRQGGDDRLAFAPGRRRHAAGQELGTQSGDSGASVWVSDRDTERSRYTRDGDANTRTRGLLLGVHLGVKDGMSVAVPAERLHEFIYSSLQPIAWERIATAPASARLTLRQRGGFGIETNDHVLPTSDRQLDHASFEFDLGDEDQRVVAVRIELADTRPGLTSSGQRPSVRVSTSQYRPGEQARSRWDRGDCDTQASSSRRRAASGVTALECPLRSVRIARGVRVEFVGNPSALRGVSVVTE